jgi:hypothetical protein
MLLTSEVITYNTINLLIQKSALPWWNADLVISPSHKRERGLIEPIKLTTIGRDGHISYDITNSDEVGQPNQLTWTVVINCKVGISKWVQEYYCDFFTKYISFLTPTRLGLGYCTSKKINCKQRPWLGRDEARRGTTMSDPGHSRASSLYLQC